ARPRSRPASREGCCSPATPSTTPKATGSPLKPSSTSSSGSSSEVIAMLYHVTFPGGSEVKVEVDHLPTGELSVTVDGKKLGAETLSQAASTAMRIDGRVVDLWMEGAPPGIGVIARGHRFYATVESERARALSAALGSKDSAVGEGTVVSPM